MSVYRNRGLPDGWQYSADPTVGGSGASANAGPSSGQKHVFPAVTGNTVAGNVANQAVGIIAAPAMAAGASATVTWTNSLIGTSSLIRILCVRRGTTTPAAGAYCLVVEAQAPASGSVVFTCFNPGSAATLSTDYQIEAEAVN